MDMPLLEQVKKDFPTACNVFGPGRFKVVSIIFLTEGTLKRFYEEAERLYIAALPSQSQKRQTNRFPGLPIDVNRDLSRYRLFKVFYPTAVPALTIVLRNREGLERVTSLRQVHIHLQEVGQAQVWYGSSYAVLQECCLNEAGQKEVGRFALWEQVMLRVWKEIEATLPPTILTPSHSPAFDTFWYQDFLRQLGYTSYQEPRWWIHRR